MGFCVLQWTLLDLGKATGILRRRVRDLAQYDDRMGSTVDGEILDFTGGRINALGARAGKRADIIIADDNFNVLTTILDGEIRYRGE